MTVATQTLVGTPDGGEITVRNPDVFFTARGVEFECVDYHTGEKVIMIITPDYLPFIMSDLNSVTDKHGRLSI